jgi:phage/plasmid-associated DNA primase
MRGEWFDFRPTFTPWLATNHRPVIKGSDAAIWDRIRLVPFNVRFRLPDEPDDGLPVADLALSEKLDAERQGILAWLIHGAVDWYQNSLGAPAEVWKATEGYRTDMDDLADFLAARCVIEPNAWIGSRTLYEAYKGWSEGSGERPLSERLFSARVTERGFTKARKTAGVQFSGLRLRAPIDDPDPDVGSDRMQHSAAFSGISGQIKNPHVETPEKAAQSYILHTDPNSGDAEERPCWSCGQSVHNATAERCRVCNWLLCSCGACGCREDDEA